MDPVVRYSAVAVALFLGALVVKEMVWGGEGEKAPSLLTKEQADSCDQKLKAEGADIKQLCLSECQLYPACKTVLDEHQGTVVSDGILGLKTEVSGLKTAFETAASKPPALLYPVDCTGKLKAEDAKLNELCEVECAEHPICKRKLAMDAAAAAKSDAASIDTDALATAIRGGDVPPSECEKSLDEDDDGNTDGVSWDELCFAGGTCVDHPACKAYVAGKTDRSKVWATHQKNEAEKAREVALWRSAVLRMARSKDGLAAMIAASKEDDNDVELETEDLVGLTKYVRAQESVGEDDYALVHAGEDAVFGGKPEKLERYNLILLARSGDDQGKGKLEGAKYLAFSLRMLGGGLGGGPARAAGAGPGARTAGVDPGADPGTAGGGIPTVDPATVTRCRTACSSDACVGFCTDAACSGIRGAYVPTSGCGH